MNRRERHKAKARQSTAGQRKKRKHSTGAASLDPEHDPNAVIIVPKSEAQKELDRRERLRQEVSASHRTHECRGLIQMVRPVGCPGRFQDEQ